jgi:hypothetical protein
MKRDELITTLQSLKEEMLRVGYSEYERTQSGVSYYLWELSHPHIEYALSQVIILDVLFELR